MSWLNEDELREWLKSRTIEAFVEELDKEWEEHVPSNERISVTELVSECPRAVFFSRIFGNYYVRMRGIIALILGKKLHEISILGKEMEKKLEWNGIVGVIDEYDPDTGLVLEKKFVSRTPREPYEHHVKQLTYYKLLLAKNNLPYSFFVLWYFAFDNFEDPVKIFVVPTPPLDVIEREAMLKKEALTFALKSGKIPQRKMSWYCLHPDTLVWTQRGVIPINQVTTNDFVTSYTFKRGFEFNKVLSVGKRYVNEYIYKIKPYGLREVYVTREHPIYVRPYKLSWRKYRKERTTLVIGNPTWKTVEEIASTTNLSDGWKKKSYYLAFPFPTIVRDISNLTKEHLEIIGYFASEGCFVHKRPNQKGYYKVRFTLGVHEKDFADRIQELAEILWSKNVVERIVIDPRDKKRKYRIIQIDSVDVANFVAKWVKGKTKVRQLAPELLYLPKEKQNTLVEALLRGNGYRGFIRSTPIEVYSTASSTLALQVMTLFLRTGRIPSLHFQINKSGFSRSSPCYHIVHHISSKHLGFIENDVYWVPLQVIDIIKYSGYVWNMEVKNAQNYVTIGGLYHNCKYCAFAKLCFMPKQQIEQIVKVAKESKVGSALYLDMLEMV